MTSFLKRTREAGIGTARTVSKVRAAWDRKEESPRPCQHQSRPRRLKEGSWGGCEPACQLHASHSPALATQGIKNLLGLRIIPKKKHNPSSFSLQSAPAKDNHCPPPHQEVPFPVWTQTRTVETLHFQPLQLSTFALQLLNSWGPNSHPIAASPTSLYPNHGLACLSAPLGLTQEDFRKAFLIFLLFATATVWLRS